MIGRFKGALELLDSGGARSEGETAEDRSGTAPAASPSQEKDLDEGEIPF